MARGRKPRPRDPESLTPTEKRAVTMKKIEERQRLLAQFDHGVKERHSSFDETPRLRKA
jgi:hypothetical protein